MIIVHWAVCHLKYLVCKSVGFQAHRNLKINFRHVFRVVATKKIFTFDTEIWANNILDDYSVVE